MRVRRPSRASTRGRSFQMRPKLVFSFSLYTMFAPQSAPPPCGVPLCCQPTSSTCTHIHIRTLAALRIHLGGATPPVRTPQLTARPLSHTTATTPLPSPLTFAPIHILPAAPPPTPHLSLATLLLRLLPTGGPSPWRLPATSLRRCRELACNTDRLASPDEHFNGPLKNPTVQMRVQTAKVPISVSSQK